MTMLSLAMRLANDNEAQDSNFRAAAHLAYYALFHKMAQHFGWNPGDQASCNHTTVRNEVLHQKHLNDPLVRAARNVYVSALKLRKHADYDWSIPLRRGDVHDVLMGVMMAVKRV